MGFDPHVHHRHSIRLRSWDYASAGAYFVTICVADRACVFGMVEDGQMRPNELGNLVTEYWRALPRHFPTIGLDAFVVMPNHVHFIVWLNPPDDVPASVGAQLNCAPTDRAPTPTPATNANRARADTIGTEPASPIGKSFRVDKQRPTLGQVVRSLKAGTTRLIHRSGKGDGFAWQRNYYERIIRDDEELRRVRRYILDNPANWATDRDHSHRIGLGIGQTSSARAGEL